MGAAALGLGTLSSYGSEYSFEESQVWRGGAYDPKSIRLVYAQIGGAFISAALALTAVLSSPTLMNLLKRNRSLLIINPGLCLCGIISSKIM